MNPHLTSRIEVSHQAAPLAAVVARVRAHPSGHGPARHVPPGHTPGKSELVSFAAHDDAGKPVQVSFRAAAPAAPKGG